MSIGGGIPFRRARGARLELGGFALERPLVEVSAATRGGMGASNRAGLLGSDVLRRFTVTFDYPGRRLFLLPNRFFAEPFETDMSGLRLRALGDRLDRITVVRRIAGSPAAAAGIAEGDEILEVDGQPAAALGLAAIRDRLERPGPVRLSLRRGGKDLAFTLELAPLV